MFSWYFLTSSLLLAKILYGIPDSLGHFLLWSKVGPQVQRSSDLSGGHACAGYESHVASGTWRLPKPNSFFKSYWCWENMRKRHTCMQVDGFQAILCFFRPVFGRFKSCLCLHVQGTRNKQSHAIATWGCLLKYPHVIKSLSIRIAARICPFDS